EKIIIYDEINSYKDSPVDLIFDEFEELVYKEAAIGRNILGNKRILKQFDKNHILNFINNNYHTDQMVISLVGNINFSKLIKSVEKHFGHIKPNYRYEVRNGQYQYTPFQKRVKKRIYQAHCVIGNLAYNIKDERRIGLGLMNNLLGGPGSNSKLNYSLREKNGLAYNVESHYTPYSDTGILTIYFGADRENINKSIKLINKEIDKLINVKLTANQLKNAKRQLTGQIAINSDNNENLMILNGKTYNIFNKVDTYEEMKEKIYSITGEKLREIANDILNKNKLSILIYE
ncbi:MAG: insulinase family protein, partial [Bacteroidales bacterium]|nr:insulinase family protein [Bacteroidales bacterium]